MKHLLPIFLIFNTIMAIADPFFPENQTEQADKENTNFAKNSQRRTACKPNNEVNIFDIDTSFQQLTLVGLVQLENTYRALFIDEKQRLIDFKVHDYLNEQSIEIDHLDLKQLRYIDWSKTSHCDKPYQITLKL